MLKMLNRHDNLEITGQFTSHSGQFVFNVVTDHVHPTTIKHERMKRGKTQFCNEILPCRRNLFDFST